MIKSLIILVLIVVLAGVAFLTRPTEASFETFVHSTTASPAAGKLSLAGVVGGLETDAYLHSIIFHDRLLWISVEQNGQTQYVGAFGHWFTTNGAPSQKS